MMRKWKTTFLSLALIELVIGFSNLRPTTFYYLGLPLGVVFFGLFLIVLALEKEAELDDRQRGAPAKTRRGAEEFREVAHPVHTNARSA